MRIIGACALTLFSLVWPLLAEAACERPWPEVYSEVAPSVVRVVAIRIDPFSLAERVQIGTGSGLVLDQAGHIATNAHVVHEAAGIMISLDDHAMLPAERVGIDLVSDLAIIRPREAAGELPQARLGKAKTLQVGEEVLAIGFPLGVGKTATKGIISGVERIVRLSPMSWLTPLIQTDAALSPGNSGGPLVDRCGTVVAINTLVVEKAQNLNFAIPIDIVMELAPQLIETGRAIRVWHGIYGQLVPPALVFTLGIAPGFLVETVEPGSPAEEIGLHGGTLPVIIGLQEYLIGGDVITKVNGEPLFDMETVLRIVRSLKIGDTIALEYWRQGELHRAEVVLPERPALPGDARRFR